MVLFKYLKREHLDAFLGKGTIRIGTLYDYRKIEKYGSVIGDDYEGRYEIDFSLPGGGVLETQANSYDGEFWRKIVLRDNPELQHKAVNIVFQPKSKIIIPARGANVYIYCMTSEYSGSVMKDFACDSCLEIINPHAFLKAISKRIRHKAKFESYAPISYLSKRPHHRERYFLSVDPALVKDPRYEYQKEWRASWIPIKTAREPLFIDVPKAIKYTREHRP